MAAQGTEEEQWFMQGLRHLFDVETALQCHRKLEIVSMDCFYFEPLQQEPVEKLAYAIKNSS